MRRLGVYGAPVSAVALEAPVHILYGQGSFLHRNHQPGHPVLLSGINIHGIRCSEPVSLVFGGRYLAFLRSLRNVSIPIQVLPIQLQQKHQEEAPSQTNSTCLTLPDWIWDCQCNNNIENYVTVTIALAHGSVQVWNMTCLDTTSVRLQYVRTVTCQPPSLVQTLRISNQQQIAMAQDGAIHVWALEQPSRISTIQVPIAGTMHALRFNHSGKQLASVSNDRSVRLWECRDETWQERWTVWGHTARVWDVAFVQGKYVVSTGGDDTIRLWNAETGMALHVWNTQRCMRSLDTFETWIAAGGEDGTVVIYNVDAFRKPILCSAREEASSLEENSSNTCRFPVPDDRVTISLHECENVQQKESISEAATELTTRKKQKKTKMAKQVLVGAEFCTFRNRLSMVVTTRVGSLLVLDLANGNWLQQANWEESQNAKDGCCMKIHPEFPIAAIGSTNGIITIVRLNGSSELLATKTTLEATRHRAVQALEWIDSTTLVSYHIHTVILWRFSSSNQLSSAEISPDFYHRCVLEAKTKGMIICGSYNKERNLFAAGDTRGNLLLFHLERSTEGTYEPVSCLPYCHRKEHINALIWVSKNKILSVGNDGCIAETFVTADWRLEPIMSTLSGQLTGITHIFRRTSSSFQNKESCTHQAVEDGSFGEISVAGYTGNRFSVLDATSGYEFANVNTSGRHRSIEVHLPMGSPQKSLMAVRESRSDGAIDLVVSAFGVDIGRVNNTTVKRHESSRAMSSSTYGIPLHSDSIFGLCVFPLNSNCQQLAVVCASEDCSSTISIFQDDKLVTVKRLPPMVSGVRTVCSSTSASGRNLLALGGGQLEIMFYIADSNYQDDGILPLLSFVGCGVPAEKQLIDQRINAMKAIVLEGKADEPRHLVVTGDSEDRVVCTLLPNPEVRKRLVIPSFRSERPILSIEIRKDGDAIYIVAGTTDGFLYVFETCEKLLLDVEMQGSQLCPTAKYRGHSMGANAVAGRVMLEPHNNIKTLRVVSVGDDQAICCCDVRLRGSEGLASIMSQISKPEASLSALKGVEWTSDQTFVTVGYDQRAVHWSVTDKISPLSITAVSIGDINCLGMCRGPHGSVVAVAGAGVELICIDDDM